MSKFDDQLYSYLKSENAISGYNFTIISLSIISFSFTFLQDTYRNIYSTAQLIPLFLINVAVIVLLMTIIIMVLLEVLQSKKYMRLLTKRIDEPTIYSCEFTIQSDTKIESIENTRRISILASSLCAVIAMLLLQPIKNLTTVDMLNPLLIGAEIAFIVAIIAFVIQVIYSMKSNRELPSAYKRMMEKEVSNF